MRYFRICHFLSLLTPPPFKAPRAPGIESTRYNKAEKTVTTHRSTVTEATRNLGLNPTRFLMPLIVKTFAVQQYRNCLLSPSQIVLQSGRFAPSRAFGRSRRHYDRSKLENVIAERGVWRTKMILEYSGLLTVRQCGRNIISGTHECTRKYSRGWGVYANNYCTSSCIIRSMVS